MSSGCLVRSFLSWCSLQFKMSGQVSVVQLYFGSGRKNEMKLSLDCDAGAIFIRMVKARLRVDFTFHNALKNVKELISMCWYKNVLCSVEMDQLLFWTHVRLGIFYFFFTFVGFVFF